MHDNMDTLLHQLCPVLVIVLLVQSVRCGVEMFRNAGMEDPDIEGVYGHAWGYSMQRVSDSHTGSYSVQLSGRTATWMGIGQTVSLKQNQAYSVHAYVKQLNNNTKFWQQYRISAKYEWSTNASNVWYTDYAQHSFGTMEEGWFKLGGDFITPSKSWHSIRLYIQGPDPQIDFLVDDMSLREIPDDPNWNTSAQQRIEQIRKTDFNISVTVDDSIDPHHVELEISLRKHEFGFGSVVQDDYFLNPDYKIYQNLFYEFFNWATVGSYKWKYNKGTPTHPNYDRSVNIANELLRQGLHVRGHNMFWGIRQNTPNWVQSLTGEQLKKTIHERIIFMTNITMGKLDHWDVNNELLHGQLYEEMTRDPTYTQKIFQEVHARDPKPKLFLNDYNVVAGGAVTDDYVNQGNAFKAANCGLYGLGLQSHFASYVEPNPAIIKYRLDKLATTGLPMWITELTLANADENIRADWFETALTVYFSYPSIEGIIFWGFWDHGVVSDGALVNGNYYYINAAGKRYLDLVKNRWSTNIKTSLTSKSSQFQFRGFYGDYDVIVRYRGKPIKTIHFTLHKNEKNKLVNVHIDGGTDEITLPTSRPTYAPVSHIHHVTHDHTQTLGHASAQSGTNLMTCTTRYSGLSAVGDDKTTDVMCSSGEVMTGCSSVTKDGQSFRDGEYFLVQGGVPLCRAVNGWRSAAPVQAIARCCQKTGLQCTYMKAGPSGHGKEDQIEVKCPVNNFAMGCTSYTYYASMDGAFATASSCIAQNDGVTDVFTYGACCTAPSLTCHVRKSTNGGLGQGETSSVACNHGETLVGCSVYSEDGSTAGAEPLSNNTCVAVNGRDRFPGEQMATAVAVCCT